jgi:hypothetical protein
MEEILASIGIFTAPALIAVGVAFLYTRAEVRRLREAQRPAGSRDDRMDRLEHAVDAIAVEVERLAQSQQFTSRLLAGREAERGREALTGSERR